ncbi:hypothetical protein ACFV2C_33760 [[Kitasatospora] papulosa]
MPSLAVGRRCAGPLLRLVAELRADSWVASGVENYDLPERQE